MQNISDLIMPFSIGIIMFGIGLELCFEDFRRVFFHPKAVITGLACQILILPAMALAIIYFWPMDPLYKVGVMLIAACPGGTTSNLLSKILKGRVALSISLTAFNSLLILFTIPLIVEFSYQLFSEGGHQINLGFWMTMKQVLFTVVLPVLAGVGINEFLSKEKREKLHKPLKYILPIILTFSFLFMAFFNKSNQDVHYLENLHLFIPLILLNGLTMITGFFIARRTGLKHKANYTIAIEMGLQNSVLALYIANQLLEEDKVSLVAIFYSTFSLLTTFGIAYLLKRSKKKEKAPIQG